MLSIIEELLAADVGAGAAPQHEQARPREARGLELRDLAQQQLADAGVLVAQIDVGGRRLDRPGGDQHALEETVRVALEVVAVLEGAGLALVGVDREVAGLGRVAHEAPFAPGREARAAEPAQAPLVERAEQLEDRLIDLMRRREVEIAP